MLKLTGCNPEGEFTCYDGQCIKLEDRCNQVPNCRDKSDERNCKILLLEDGYEKQIPPTKAGVDNTVVPVNVKISITLMKVMEIKERENSIYLQFEINLKWKEDRARYQNLKDKTFNSLTDDDISKLWLPLVIYSNTDQKESTRLGESWEWVTRVIVVKEGKFTRNDLHEIDEAEIYEGGENPLIMTQAYTWRFHCPYKLHSYPFDTQVNL